MVQSAELSTAARKSNAYGPAAGSLVAGMGGVKSIRDATRRQALALGRVEPSLYHLCRWPRCSGGLRFARADRSIATKPPISAIVKCGPQTNSLLARRA